MIMMTLKPDQHNANRGTKRGKDLLKRSLQELGAGRSILVDKDGQVIAGNKTLEQAQALGMKIRVVEAGRDELVAVQRPDLDLNDGSGEARRLAYLDNRVGELDLDWDQEQLKSDIEAGLDFDQLGFLEGELNGLIDEDLKSARMEKDPGPQDEKNDEILKKWAVKAGQIWQIGVHRLICGDITDPEVLCSLLENDQAVLAFTSPPYWVGKSYETQKSEIEIDEFIHQTAISLDCCVRKDESRIVINTGTGFTTAFDKKAKRHVLLLVDKWTDALRGLGWNLRHVRHWIKEGQLMATSPKTDIIDQHNEFIATFEHQDGKPRQFEDLFIGEDINLLMTFYRREGKQRGQEWTGEKWALRSYWDDIKGTARECGHEAAFPVELPLRHLMLYTKAGEIVFEPFCGSGTTIIACEVMKRKCLAAEISPAYVAATLERWMKMTGVEPKILRDSHDNLEA
jgi:DNA modification methylase